ncbi:hypothetical protein [Olivibacter sitiensis]|uniref:hypothetical protein n=1 Tax=Olivibacter sitiensis TaxID=376470 RepID=UPI000411FD70|nr:hypothetical protein [Olivibacter sitiensis]
MNLLDTTIWDYLLFNTTRDSLIIKEFPFGETFRSSQRPNITDRYDGKINEVTISRKYERIFYSADIIIAVSTANGGYFHLNGKFKGSRMGQTSSKVSVH